MDFDAYIYLLIVGGFQASLAVLVTVVLAVVKPFHRKLPFVRIMARYFLFNFWLLAWGLIGNFLWYSTATDWLYKNPDPVVEWIPFVVPGNWTIDPVCGGALTPGTTWPQMYLMWFAIAAPVWALTIFAYRKTRPFILDGLSPSGLRQLLALASVIFIVGMVSFFRMMFR